MNRSISIKMILIFLNLSIEKSKPRTNQNKIRYLQDQALNSYQQRSET